MSVRYIGSKARLVDSIVPLIGLPDRGGQFVDAFCGTGVVAEAAARAGWRIRLNDHLLSAVTMSHARLVPRQGAAFTELGGYAQAVERLNQASPLQGFLWREYSPASQAHAGVERRYFTEKNAALIDGIRSTLSVWHTEGVLSLSEERLLLADLLLAANAVANIAGTYGCFLSQWSAKSQCALALRPRMLFPFPVDVQATVSDVAAVQTGSEDVVYLDPPYTKRQYAAYYHVLETIAAGDTPSVGGITGLRPWREKASDFCYRKRALSAVVKLVLRQAARRVLLSCSSQGHVAVQPLAEALAAAGSVTVVPLKEVVRYTPNRAAREAGRAVTEYVLIIERTFHVATETGSK